MNISKEIVALANELRVSIQDRTQTVSDGEGVAMVLLWTFLMDHARAHDINVEELARDQLEAFITHAGHAFEFVRSH
jgi:hypothetical protein